MTPDRSIAGRDFFKAWMQIVATLLLATTPVVALAAETSQSNPDRKLLIFPIVVFIITLVLIKVTKPNKPK